MKLHNSTIMPALLTVLLATNAIAEDEIATREQAAASVAAQLVTELGGTLMTQMSEGGPEAAIAVCRDIAPATATALSLKHGWRVTRVGTRVRNSLTGTPDAWERDGLELFEARAAAGESFASMTYAQIVTEGKHRYFRYLKPIGTQTLCLACHGSPNAIAPAVQEILDQHYPHDQAVDYEVGDLRGAISIKQPLDQLQSAPAPEDL